jgi:hypothetical protein
MKRLILLLIFTSLQSPGVLADFSRSSAALHPHFPGTGPFLIEIAGTWPSDCHPGEQKPVINAFDGHTVEIEFEIIVVHVTCNDTETAYRSLVDMSEAVRATPSLGDVLELRVDFQDTELRQSLDLVCPAGETCALDDGGLLPERGLYVTAGRAHEGLLVARQNDVTAIYPLVYDDTGRAEWLFSAGHVAEDTFFADLTRWTGGDCFDCEPTDSNPDMTDVGFLSVLIERPGVMQVKVNDRPFTEYEKVVYGYEVIRIGDDVRTPLADLQGRWALSENHGTDPPLGDLSNFLPPAFDLVAEKFAIGDGPEDGSGQAIYRVTGITGEELAQLVCREAADGEYSTPVCEYIDPTDQAEPLLLFYPTGPSSLVIEYGRAVIAVGIPPGGTAVRLD